MKNKSCSHTKIVLHVFQELEQARQENFSLRQLVSRPISCADAVEPNKRNTRSNIMNTKHQSLMIRKQVVPMDHDKTRLLMKFTSPNNARVSNIRDRRKQNLLPHTKTKRPHRRPKVRKKKYKQKTQLQKLQMPYRFKPQVALVSNERDIHSARLLKNGRRRLQPVQASRKSKSANGLARSPSSSHGNHAKCYKKKSNFDKLTSPQTRIPNSTNNSNSKVRLGLADALRQKTSPLSAYRDLPRGRIKPTRKTKPRKKQNKKNGSGKSEQEDQLIQGIHPLVHANSGEVSIRTPDSTIKDVAAVDTSSKSYNVELLGGADPSTDFMLALEAEIRRVCD